MDLDKGTGFVCSPSCGDVLKLNIQVDYEGAIETIQVKAFGCKDVKDMEQRLDQIIGMYIEDIIYIEPDSFIAPSDNNNHVAILAINGIRAAVTNYAEKKYKAEEKEEEARRAGTPS